MINLQTNLHILPSVQFFCYLHFNTFDILNFPLKIASNSFTLIYYIQLFKIFEIKPNSWNMEQYLQKSFISFQMRYVYRISYKQRDYSENYFINWCKSHYHVYVSFTEIREEISLLYLKANVGLVVASDLINLFRAFKAIRVQTYFMNIFSQSAPKGGFFWISGFALQYSTRHLWKLRGWLTKSRVALEFRFLLMKAIQSV